MTTPITEEFDNTRGELVGYDSAVANFDYIVHRRHVNLRNFQTSTEDTPLTMISIDLITGDALEDMTIEDLEGTTATITDENWTAGTYGPDAAYGYRSTLRLNVTTSVLTTRSNLSAVDLSSFDADDWVIITLPNLDTTLLDYTASFLRLYQDGSSVTLPFSGHTTNGSGGTSVKWPLSMLGQILKPTGVELEVKGLNSGVLTIGAIRILPPDYFVVGPDIDTVTTRMQPTWDHYGIATTATPRVWRASDPPGEDDPMPINTKLAMNFFTGHNAASNKVQFFFRSRREDYLTQLDLDGVDFNDDGIMEYGTSQGDLDDYGTQPDYGRAMYDPRPQTDYDNMDQSVLDTYSQAEMERAPDFISESWLQVDISWGSTNSVLISTTETDDDTEILMDATFTPQTNYVAMVDVIDESVRVHIYEILDFGQIDRENPVFDTNEINNTFLIKRRKGRVGWKIDLGDGDTYINSIRSRGLMFGEVITQNFESYTPVEGARLFVGATPDLETVLDTGPFNSGIVEYDVFNTQSQDGSAKITAGPAQGIQSQPVIFEDFENSEIKLDLYYPKSTLDAGFYPGVYLLGTQNLFIQFSIPGIIGDTWNSLTLTPTRAFIEQTGAYRVIVLQETGSATFWVDNFRVNQRQVKWSGRATLLDPWGRERNKWTEFRSLVNSETNGIMFPERDRFLQIRGQTLTQGASIEKVYAKPKYAELGRLVWNVNRKYRAVS